MERFINVNNKIYSLKFGTKCLIKLQEFLNHISEERELINLKFFLAIEGNRITYDEAMSVLNILIDERGIDYVQKLLSEVLELSTDIDINNLCLSIEELYRKAVGEMGIAPQIFYEMSPREINIAYQGYLDKKELEANCMLIALRKFQDNKATLISLLDKEGWEESTIEKRNEVFDALGI